MLTIKVASTKESKQRQDKNNMKTDDRATTAGETGEQGWELKHLQVFFQKRMENITYFRFY